MRKRTKVFFGTAAVVAAASVALAVKTKKDFNGITIKAENMK